MSDTPSCARGERTCIASLAEGWIRATDLCPPCTQAFMSALDSIGGPLHWHKSYLDRSAGHVTRQPGSERHPSHTY